MRTALSLLSLAIPALGAGIVYNDQIDAAYDFVIAGGGLAGLVLASRLSEDSNTTVLVLEAGASVTYRADIPGNAYYSSLLNTDYDWQYMTVPQPNAGNRVLPWPRGKVLGGSTAVNGLYLVRPSAIEVDAWSQLLPGQSSAAAWSWASLFEAMKKSETFTEPSDAIKNAGRIQYDVTSHGRSGPLHYAYPGFIVPVVGNWTSTLDWVGIPPSPDANGGSGWGAFIATSSINPSNWTRSYSRSAYIDPLGPRPNLAILPNATVTKIIWAPNNDGNGKKVAQGVEFAASRGAPRRSVTARKEVILAGGHWKPKYRDAFWYRAQASPGRFRDTLYELPGVGAHLQDHIATEVVFRTTAETAASIRGSAIAYANITDLFGDWAPTFQEQVRANMSDNVNALVPNDPRVKAGYQAVYEATTEKILMSQAGQPLCNIPSRKDTSTSIPPILLTHPSSTLDTFPILGTLDDPRRPETCPKARPNSTSQRKHRRRGISRRIRPNRRRMGRMVERQDPNEYHPSCTMSMLPEEQAGVVDADLRMYGTSNVRVVDSSIYPIQFAAHLMAPTYGMAEQAASIIRAQYNGVPPPASTVPTSASGSATQTANPNNGNGNNTNGGVVGLKNNNVLWAALCLMAGLVMVI
ncbi:alcohol oxidase [Rhizoctonia solani]|uniref:Alcohol oxidase n=1 Tax=Rhizoctonia solani TaxID=456999 RepID=A0A8H7IGY7_9AGAM|nr:alcohol oxidase [Rhizoctonia solani]